MRTTIYKRIIGVVIIVFLFALVAPTNVNAVSEECKALKKENIITKDKRILDHIKLLD